MKRWDVEVYNTSDDEAALYLSAIPTEREPYIDTNIVVLYFHFLYTSMIDCLVEMCV